MAANHNQTFADLTLQLSSGEIAIVDLSRTLSTETPLFDPSDTGMKYETLSTLDNDGCETGYLAIPEHFGTHIDAPSHFVKGATIDNVPLEKLVMPGVVIDVRKQVQANADYMLTVEDVKNAEQSLPITPGSIILLLTGWSEKYEDADRYRNADASGKMHFPGYSVAAAQYLIETNKASAFGIDTLSVDSGASTDYAVHKFALAKGVLLIENLHQLENLPLRGSIIFCGALKIENGTGSPARVLALAPR
jgi:kynurenine formamidase